MASRDEAQLLDENSQWDAWVAYGAERDSDVTGVEREEGFRYGHELGFKAGTGYEREANTGGGV